MKTVKMCTKYLTYSIRSWRVTNTSRAVKNQHWLMSSFLFRVPMLWYVSRFFTIDYKLNNFLIITLIWKQELGGDLNKYSKIAAWFERCKALPSAADNFAGAKILGEKVRSITDYKLWSFQHQMYVPVVSVRKFCFYQSILWWRPTFDLETTWSLIKFLEHGNNKYYCILLMYSLSSRNRTKSKQ